MDAGSAGLCGRCWEGLQRLPDLRCPLCALVHPAEEGCPQAIAWRRGDALWDYHGGRPALGALLVPGIKAGERGWRTALLDRAEAAALPDWITAADAVVPAPTLFLRRLRRGSDLAAEWAERLGRRTGKPVLKALTKHWRARAQTGRPESERRRLPREGILLRHGVAVQGFSLLLVDDVWTTGATLHRCAQTLGDAGAREVNVLTLFRAT
jgi:predicted amidophosphoribosyltransferase